MNFKPKITFGAIKLNVVKATEADKKEEEPVTSGKKQKFLFLCENHRNLFLMFSMCKRLNL